MNDKATLAMNLAEISSDLLHYAARDARSLANAAQQHVGNVLCNASPIGSAMSLAASADKLAAKLEAMRGDVVTRLAELIALDAADHQHH